MFNLNLPSPSVKFFSNPSFPSFRAVVKDLVKGLSKRGLELFAGAPGLDLLNWGHVGSSF
jgi:hypothetical protein